MARVTINTCMHRGHAGISHCRSVCQSSKQKSLPPFCQHEEKLPSISMFANRGFGDVTHHKKPGDLPQVTVTTKEPATVDSHMNTILPSDGGVKHKEPTYYIADGAMHLSPIVFPRGIYFSNTFFLHLQPLTVAFTKLAGNQIQNFGNLQNRLVSFYSHKEGAKSYEVLQN